MTLRRVAVLSYHTSPLAEPGSGDAGGMTVYVREVAAALAEQGIGTDIFTRATHDLPRVVQLGDAIRVVAVDAGPREPLEKEQLTAHVAEFAGNIRGFAIAGGVRYDVIHSHYWQSGLAARALAESWRVPLVHSHHTLGRVKNRLLAPDDEPEPVIRIKGEEEVIADADVMVASTMEEWRQCVSLYAAPPAGIKVIPPGVDHDLFTPGDQGEARVELGLTGDPLLLCVGRVQPLKGLELAIRVLAEFTHRGVGDPRLVVVGGASGRRGELEALKLRELGHSLGIGDRVAFVGPRPHHRLPSYYRAADVLLVSSYSESFGLAALEAQACGLPIVGTAVGGLPDVVGDGRSGFIVSERDPALIAERVRTIVSNEELRRQFVVAAEERAAGFSWKATAGALIELYECLVREEQPEVCTC